MIKIDKGIIEIEGMGGEILAELLTLISSRKTLGLIENFVLDEPKNEVEELFKKVYNVGEEINNFCEKRKQDKQN